GKEKSFNTPENPAIQGKNRYWPPRLADKRPLSQDILQSHFSINSKSSGQVTLKLRNDPGTNKGAWPAASIADASSVTAIPADCASVNAARSRPARNICGVCASHS